MNFFTELFANLNASSRLKPKFRRATSIIGMLGVIVGLALLYVVMGALEDILGLDPNAPVRESIAGLVWLGFFLAALPLSFYAAVVPIAWLGGHVFIRIGYMKQEDLKYYALRSRYPAHWLEDSF